MDDDVVVIDVCLTNVVELCDSVVVIVVSVVTADGIVVTAVANEDVDSIVEDILGVEMCFEPAACVISVV